MQSRARLPGHPRHPMLIVFPLGLLASAVIVNVIALITSGSTWATLAYRMFAGGLIRALLAAPFGFIEWHAIPDGTRAQRIGALHGGANTIVTLLFLAGAWPRTPREVPGTPALACSFGGAAVALVAAWLGGELVARLGIGADVRAGLDAPRSLEAP